MHEPVLPSSPNLPLSEMTLRLGHLYPATMNMYGDRGNVLALVKRAQWRGIAVELVPMDPTPDPPKHWLSCDLYFMGGGQDTQQLAIQHDLLRHKKGLLKYAAAEGAVFLTVCGGYQLLGHGYQPYNAPYIEGLHLMDVETEAGSTRFIGNVIVQRPNGTTLVGFENHSGLTHLGGNAQPLGKVLKGHGNNGHSGFEGAVQGRLFGTYLHGSLLPKNPEFADELLLLALQRRYPELKALPPLLNTLEEQAHQRALTLV